MTKSTPVIALAVNSGAFIKMISQNFTGFYDSMACATLAAIE